MYITICEIDHQFKFDALVKQGTQSWCTGTTQRDEMGREVGAGLGPGDTGIPVADSCQYMAKTSTKL